MMAVKMMSLRGKLLLASPEMGDPNFERSVILMVQHSAEGAMGLVLNRPTDQTVGEVLSASPDVDDEVACGTDELLYRGGPCEGPLMVLHGDAAMVQEQVTAGVYFAPEGEYVARALWGALRPARFFAGYAGWGGGQLEGELAQSAWIVMDAEVGAVFDQRGSGRDDPWRGLIRVKKAGELLKGYSPKIVPRDPSMN
ncbi:MAG: YqgE/AlgH family protein [Planctomycetota bacterium]